MRELIVLESSAVGQASSTAGTAALDLQAPSVTLEFRILASDPDAIEAVRHARRAMLREEWTRGREPDEPSLEEATFSPFGVEWTVTPGQRKWCLQKMAELEARAERALASLEAGHPAGGPKQA